ncbi:cytosolic Cu/Zn superoxide dismutase, putative [Talaromyces marneffei ATCC 18224]|uniref:superoxide dismutase n=1 Tax=Talaromyces marneffei (strain ATCC 18224 / CBS 334.59 / QM 7333) TaxID=441960 RepID=B6QR55_TALMQ|nr:cytosolic Cu/Zn superoxide dismutase, putative [Talaromyces marneffei ATCC 18224]
MILSLLLLPSLALSALGQGFTHAPVITNNPPTTYTATLFDNPSTTVRGNVTASGAPDGVGLVFRVNFTGLPANIGPFPYHVHVSPVPANGNCSAAGEHLDPFNRGEQPPCDPSDPATCQVGDLSGKHGFATGTSFFAEYTDLYLSTDPGSNAFIGDSGTRLNCGNFQLVSGVQATVARLNVATRGGSSSTTTHTSTRTSSTRVYTRTSSTRPTSTRTSSTRPTTHTSSTRPTTHTSSTRSTTRTTTARSVPTQPPTFTTQPRTSTRS